MRKILYAAILGALLLAPVKRLDVAVLEPVQTVALYTEEQQLVVETDTGNVGKGKSIHDAIKDLEENTPGVIYLDTAQYLLVTEKTSKHLQELSRYLKPNVKISRWDGESSIKSAAQYLEIRKDLHTLRYYKNISKK